MKFMAVPTMTNFSGFSKVSRMFWAGLLWEGDKYLPPCCMLLRTDASRIGRYVVSSGARELKWYWKSGRWNCGLGLRRVYTAGTHVGQTPTACPLEPAVFLGEKEIRNKTEHNTPRPVCVWRTLNINYGECSVRGNFGLVPSQVNLQFQQSLLPEYYGLYFISRLIREVKNFQDNNKFSKC